MMNSITPFVRASGHGENILCLHSCLGSSKQWDSLRKRFEKSYRITATDLYGSGKTPDWSLYQPLRLEDEANLLKPVLEQMPTPVHLIGHSYGAAVALKVAQMYPGKIASLIVYEPVLFTLLFAGTQLSHAAGEIFLLVASMRAHYRSGESSKAVEKFIDYWSGEGSWNRFDHEQQKSMAARAAMVLANFNALMSEQSAGTLFEQLTIPTLCLYGGRSPDTTVEITRIAARLSSRVELRCLPELGHMGPITDSAYVNCQIDAFLKVQKQQEPRGQFSEAA